MPFRKINKLVMKESNNFGCKGELLILSKLIQEKYFLIAKALGGAWIPKV